MVASAPYYQEATAPNVEIFLRSKALNRMVQVSVDEGFQMLSAILVRTKVTQGLCDNVAAMCRAPKITYPKSNRSTTAQSLR